MSWFFFVVVGLIGLVGLVVLVGGWIEHTSEGKKYNEVSFVDRQHTTKTQHEPPMLAYIKSHSKQKKNKKETCLP